MSFKNKMILITFDIEEFDVPCEQGITVDFERQMAVSREGTETILKVLQKHPSVRATFYVTGRFAEAAPDLIERLKTFGEIASHGYAHSGFEKADLEKSRRVLEKISSTGVTGFRMPRMAKVGKEDLKAAGYEYDSSLNPTWIPGRYNALSAPAQPFTESCGLRQIPASVTPFLRFPLFWLSFKNIPLWLFTAFARRTLRKRGFLNLYWHPWEFSAAIAEPEFKIPPFMRRDAGEGLAKKLDLFLSALENHGQFMTTAESCQTFFSATAH